MPDHSQLNQQLHELDRLLEALEQLNLRNQTVLPKGITDRLQALGIVDVKGVDPSVLIPRVLDEQQSVRRRLASTRRGRTT
jgi:flagellar biosynthesis/type III secretory pathway chaperone